MKRRILVILIFLFSLSQVSTLVVSLYRYNKDYAGMLTENEETEECSCEKESKFEGYSSCGIQDLSLASVLSSSNLYFSPDISVLSSDLAKPETPPPNFC